MQNNIVTVNKPKTRQAALNQAIYVLDQLRQHNKRKENILMNKNNTQQKIEKLKLVLQELDTQIEKVDTTVSNWDQVLADLKLDFNLTESEILTLQSELTRSKIEELRKKADILETGKSEQF